MKKEKYIKIYWKLKSSLMCPIHNTLLINHCTSCGKEIGYSEIISGICSCGTLLEDMVSTYIKDQYVLKNQNRFYSWFNILSIKIDTKIKNYNRVDYTEHIDLLYYLSGIANTLKYIEYFIDNNYYFDSICEDEIKHIVVVEKVIINWPHTL